MQFPGLGNIERDSHVPEWLRSGPVSLPLLGGAAATVVLEQYEEDHCKRDFEVAVANLLTCSFDVFKRAEPYIFKYYLDTVSALYAPDDPEFLRIESPERVWEHVQLGTQPVVSRRGRGERAVYVSFECECEWEPEHGLQIVLRNGDTVVKIGPHDGHLTNSDAWDDRSLENVIYVEH